MTRLGVCYETGHGVEQDVQRAEDLYRRAMALGELEGQYCLAGLLRRRKDPESHREAARLLQKPAAVGMPRAQYLLGVCYETGDGVEKKPRYAAYMYHRAALQGHPEAMLRLGICYETGVGTEKDPAIAANLYRQAAEQGSDLARCRLGRLYEQGLGVERDLRRAEELYEAGTRAGVSGAKEALDRVRAALAAPPEPQPEDKPVDKKSPLRRLLDRLKGPKSEE